MNTIPPISELIEQLQSYGVGEWAVRDALPLDFRCPYCDTDFLASYDNFYSWNCDHIVPLSRGGDNDAENLVSCCRTCNALKRSYVPIGNTRPERIADARRYIQEKRKNQETRLAAIRALGRPHAPLSR